MTKTISTTYGVEDPTYNRFYNFIDGQYCDAASGEWIDSINPATGRVWAQVPASNSVDADAAVAAAKRTFERFWWRMPPMQKAALLRNLAMVIDKHADRLAEAESRDNGRPYTETRAHDVGMLNQINYYNAGMADKLEGESKEIGPTSLNYVRYEPFGVAVIITPWNAPLAMCAGAAATALAAGCTVIVKPPESASCSSLMLAELFKEAGFPDGAMNVVSGFGSVVGNHLVGHPDVGKVAFTGSTLTARNIIRRSADAIKPLTMELGGKSANIIMPDADLEAATIGATTGAIFTSGAGQACIAGSRILVHRSIHDEMVERFIAKAKAIQLGDPTNTATQMGPLALDRQLDKVTSYLDIAKQEGAELVCGGGFGNAVFGGDHPLSGGYWVEPTIYIGVNNQMRIAREEIFGPVAAVIPFEDEEEAIAIANDSEYGLAAAVWTQNLKCAMRVAQSIRVGAMWINCYRRMHWAVPFGGIKDSGYGRGGVREYQYAKGVWCDFA